MPLSIFCDKCFYEIPTNGIPSHKILCKACHDAHTSIIIAEKDQIIGTLKSTIEEYKLLVTKLTQLDIPM